MARLSDIHPVKLWPGNEALAQLEKEIELGSWVFAPPMAAPILDATPETVWCDVLRSQGIEPGALVQGGGAEA